MNTFTLSRFAPALAGKVVIPEDARFDEARRAWNLAVDQEPAAVVFPESAPDVAAAVRLAVEAGQRIAAQGTGHGAATLGPLGDTILVKTERMRGLAIDPVERIARAEAGKGIPMPLTEARTVDDVQLGPIAFWAQPLEERNRAFAALRDRCNSSDKAGLIRAIFEHRVPSQPSAASHTSSARQPLIRPRPFPHRVPVRRPVQGHLVRRSSAPASTPPPNFRHMNAGDQG